MSRAGKLIGPRLGNHVDKAPRGAAELGGGTLIDHYEFLDGVLVESECRPLAAALLSEERVVEVRTVDDEVIENASLAADVELVAIRSLGNRGTGREQGHVHEVAAIAREPVDYILLHALRASDISGVKRWRQLADHGDGLGCHQPEVDRYIERFANPQHNTLDAFGAEAGDRRRDGEIVGAGRQQGTNKGPGRRGLDAGQQVCLPVLNSDRSAGQCVARWITNGTANDAGGRTSLGRKSRRARVEERDTQHHEGQSRNDSAAGA